LRLMTDTMFYVAHWITPVGEPRRFDTRFFMTRAPATQEPLHDDGETIASLWVRPADALAEERAGRMIMMPPTVICLKSLAGHADSDSALREAAAMGVPPVVLPKLKPGTPVDRPEVLLPGEPGYDELP